MTRTTPPRALAALPLAAALLAVTACSGEDADATPPATTTATATAEGFELAAHTVTTAQGDVEVPADPRRIVVLNHALAGYLYDLDVPVAATTSEDADGEEAYSPFWAEEAEADGTRFLPWSADGFNLEAIAAADPDLIVGGGTGFPLFLATGAYAELSAIAPTVLVGGDLDTWQAQFEFLADDVFDRRAVYEEALSDYEARTAEVEAAITPPPAPAVTVSVTADLTPYVLVEDRGLPAVLAAVGIAPAPLFASGDFQPYTPGGDSFELSDELVGQVLTQPTTFVTGFNGADVGVAQLRQDPLYAALPSFAGGHAHDLPSWAHRADFDETMALLDTLEGMFG